MKLLSVVIACPEARVFLQEEWRVLLGQSFIRLRDPSRSQLLSEILGARSETEAGPPTNLSGDSLQSHLRSRLPTLSPNVEQLLQSLSSPDGAASFPYDSADWKPVLKRLALEVARGAVLKVYNKHARDWRAAAAALDSARRRLPPPSITAQISGGHPSGADAAHEAEQQLRDLDDLAGKQLALLRRMESPRQVEGA